MLGWRSAASMVRSGAGTICLVSLVALSGCAGAAKPQNSSSLTSMLSKTPAPSSSASSVSQPHSHRAQPDTSANTTPPSLFIIHMVTSTAGWAGGTADASAFIARTTDGGTHWVKAEPAPAAKHPGYGLVGDFLDSDHAVLAAVNHGTHIFTTGDGGRSWTQGGTVPYKAGSMALDFLTTSDGWYAVGSPGMSRPLYADLYRTADGGRTWQHLRGKPFGFGCLAFVNSSVGWTSTSPPGLLPELLTSALMRTTDGGQTWKMQPVTAPPGGTGTIEIYGCPSITGKGTAVLPALVGKTAFSLYHMRPGFTWAPSSVLALSPQATQDVVDVLSEEMAWYSDGIKLYATSDGGATWHAISPNVSLRYVQQLDFVSVTEGWAIVMTANGSELLKTTDGGQIWTELPIHLRQG